MAVNVRNIVDDLDSAIAFPRGAWASRSSVTPVPASRCSRGASCAFCWTARPDPGEGRGRCRADAGPSDIVMGNGGRQILPEDPAGNPNELFEPRGE